MKTYPFMTTSRSVCFLTITEKDKLGLKSKNLGNIILELYNDIVPKTAENFKCLCTGEKGFGYKNSAIDKHINGFLIQGGDFTTENGEGGWSIYGKYFKDENLETQHEIGCISMANSGPDTNSSHFFITVAPTKHLDGRYVVFGKVIEGMEIVNYISQDELRSGRAYYIISDCGEIKNFSYYFLLVFFLRRFFIFYYNFYFLYPINCC